jgi:hypothetical protein
MTLVDQSRGIKNRVEITGYDERIMSTFSNSPRHRFVQELRNDLIHVALHQPGWRFATEPDLAWTTRLMLRPKQLRRSQEWHSLARQFLQQNPEGVDLGSLIAAYRTEVDQFQNWFQDALIMSAGDLINDYVRCNRFLRAIGARCWWQLLLQQFVIGAGRNPFDHLDRYLTPSELKEINALPSRSKRQVNRIIEFVDEDGVCDEELRSLAYKAFGAEEP